MTLLMKDSRGCSKSIDALDSTCHYYLKLALIIWSTHFPVSFLWSFNCKYNVLSIQAKDKSFQKFMFSFKSLFFWHESQLAGPITKTKKVNVG